MDDTAKIETAKDMFRLDYSQNAPGLRALIDKIKNNGALEAVTITGDSFEGRSHQGQLTFHPTALLRAALDIYYELSPEGTLPEPPLRGALTDFRTQVVST
jgi:hypothetical protein